MTAVETGWGADGHFGTWSELGPSVASRRIHPPAPETAPADTWWWIALCAAGCTARGAGRTVTGVGAWLVDVDSRDVARHCADAVRTGGSPEHWFRALRVRRERRWCRWTGALLGAVGCTGAGWWGALQLTSGQCSALVAAGFGGALWWCWWFGQAWDGAVDGAPPRMPAPLTMPTAPEQPAHRQPTRREFLLAAALVFHPAEVRLASAELAERMAACGAPWSGLTGKAVGDQLGDLGLKSVRINFFDDRGVRRNWRGFTREAIERALQTTVEPLPES